jgi:hypothetical protein
LRERDIVVLLYGIATFLRITTMVKTKYEINLNKIFSNTTLGLGMRDLAVNKRLMSDLRSVGIFCGVYHKKSQLHFGAIARR